MESKGGSILHEKKTRAIEIVGKKTTTRIDRRGDPVGRPYDLSVARLQYINDQLFFQPPYRAALFPGFSCADTTQG